ncbi:MAG: ATP-binding protein [Elusimicrobiota bacterium]
MSDAETKIRILIVDDDNETRELQAAVLEKEGYPVDQAASMGEARKRLAERGCGVLLLDLRLPNGEGLDLLHEAHAVDPHSVGVVLTAFTSTDSTLKALREGAYDYLAKPCPPEIVLSAVSRAAERYALTRTLAERTRELENANRDLNRRVESATAEIFALNEKLQRHLGRLLQEHGALTRFLEDMAHELKNPLSVVWGYTSFLLKRPLESWTPAELKRALESIYRNAGHLHSLIEELLESTRLAGRKVKLEPKLFPAAEAVRESVFAVAPQAEEKGVALTADAPDDAPVFADRDRLHQILGNLLGNALKFTPSGGKITLSVRREGEHSHFCVADTGPGIAPAHLVLIFERFYQVTPAEQGRKDGLGLGLSIVKGLVDLHGGRIWVESEPGKGARFHFLLPATPRPLSPRAPALPGSADSISVN